jgi:uncharacterized protein (TIGR01777 family)
MTSEPTPIGRVVIAGGTGFIGTNLARHLTDLGCEVVLISRNVPKQERPWKHAQWDGRTVGQWAKHLESAVAVVNLAGRTVDCIKTPDHCDEILRSRVEATLTIGKALRDIAKPPPVWVQMATAHIYGDPPEAVCDEDSPFGFGLAPIVGKAWEAAFAEAAPSKMRQVILRTSFVLGANGGAFPKMRMLARCGLGGRVGHGRQGISWIHIDDMSRLIARAIIDDAMKGAYIATAPNPVSYDEFMRTLRRAIRMPIGLPAAEWMVRFGARYLMRTDPELVLYGRYCVSHRLEKENYEFSFPDIKSAMESLCHNS